MSQVIARKGHVAHLSRLKADDMHEKASQTAQAAPGTVRRRPVRLSGSRSKYGVRNDPEGKARRTVDGHVFASQAECRRYGELKLLEKAGEIRDLARQPIYHLRLLGETIGSYVPDFRYFERDGSRVVEDVKGYSTPLYRWKKKHFEIQYGIQIREIRSGRRR